MTTARLAEIECDVNMRITRMPDTADQRAELLAEVKRLREHLAYAYYAASRRANQHEPVAFRIWRDMVPDSQINEMVSRGGVR